MMKFSFQKIVSISLLSFGLFVFSSSDAEAACAAPAGNAGEFIWVEGSLHYRYCDGTNWRIFSDGYTTNASTLDGVLPGFFLRTDASNANDIRISGVDGLGIRFSDNDHYKIYMSASGNATWGGRLDATSDYNMYFTMNNSGGFVFRNNASNVYQITQDGRHFARNGALIHEADGGNIYTYGASGWYNGTHGGGWFMEDATNLKPYNGKSIYLAGYTLRTDDILAVRSGTTKDMIALPWDGFRYIFWGAENHSACVANNAVSFGEATICSGLPNIALRVSGNPGATGMYGTLETTGMFLKRHTAPNATGDLNNDGIVSVADRSIVNSYARGFTGLANYQFLSRADFNKDGFVTLEDYDAVNALLVGTDPMASYDAKWSSYTSNETMYDISFGQELRLQNMNAVQAAFLAILSHNKANYQADIRMQYSAQNRRGDIFRNDNGLFLGYYGTAPISLLSGIFLHENGHTSFGHPNSITYAPAYGIDLQNTAFGRGIATAWVTYSDGRFKENVAKIPDAIEKLKALQGVSYTWVHDTEDKKREIGFIAQDVEKILPELVSITETEVKDAEGNVQTISDYRSVNYDRVTALLVEAFKVVDKQSFNTENVLKENQTHLDKVDAGLNEMYLLYKEQAGKN